MKKSVLISLIFLLYSGLIFSQVAINADGSSPHPSAGLDINFVNKGVLLPRMTFEQINAIQVPAEGLMIYCTNCNSDASGALSIYQNGVWRVFNPNCSTPFAPAEGTHVSGLDQITWNWGNVPIAVGFLWNDINDINTADTLGAVTAFNETGLTCWSEYTRYLWAYNSCGISPALELTASTQSQTFSPAPSPAFQIPTAYTIAWSWFQVPTALGYRIGETNNPDSAVILPSNSTLVYLEENLDCSTSYTRYLWSYGPCGLSSVVVLNGSTIADPPDSPTASTHVPSVNQIVWNWNTVADADGYKWNTVSNYSTATDLLAATTKTETELVCDSSYTRYVWAYSDCGVSAPVQITQATLQDPPDPPASTVHQSTEAQITWNWLTVADADGYKWNSTNDYDTAINKGLNTSHIQTGLNCNSTYTSYVWSYNECGVSAPQMLTKSTALDPPAAPSTAIHNATVTSITWKWHPVADADEYKWNDSNNYVTAQTVNLDTAYNETNLSCNNSYTRYVWSVNECGVSVPTTLTQATNQNPPAAPTAASHTPQAYQITWNWSPVATADGYRWNSINDYNTADSLGLNTSKVQTGLDCNNSYTSYVWAFNECGVSSATVLTQSTSLDPPDNPVAGSHAASLNAITWTWQVVPGADGYKWGITNVYDSAVEMSTATSKPESGLECNTSYTRYVWAYSECGVSSITSLTQSTTLDPPDAPAAAVHEADKYQITWKWMPVSDATGYKWNTSNTLTGAAEMGTDTAKLETGLTCNSSYTRYVWAYGDCGISGPTALLQSTELDPPGSPVENTHVPTYEQIIWKWYAVTGAEGYKWNDSNIYATATDMGTSLSSTQTGLTCNTSYNSYVWAYSNCGVSGQTVLTQATSLNPPAAPTTGTHVAEAYQIEWHWNTVTAADGYKWNDSSSYSTANEMGSNTVFTEYSLNCDSSYTRYVWAYNECGVSSTGTLTKQTLQDPPDSPDAGTHVPALESIEWHWNAVTNATGYKWNTTSDIGTAQALSSTITSFNESSISCNIEHTSYVWAISPCGTSAATTLTASTLSQSPDAPLAGTHTATSAQVTWNWGTVSNATGYKWNSDNVYGAAQDMGANTTKTQTGLACNTSYSSYVWAYGPCGFSQVTPLSYSTTADPPAAPVAASHTAGATQITWNWNAVSGATAYLWNSTDDFNNVQNNGTSTSKTETSLTCNQSYTRYVWAVNGCDTSSSTVLTQSTTAAPVVPTVGTHVPSYTQITWDWNVVADATGYKWSNTNDFGTATDVGMNTSYTQTSLTCGNSYTGYAWAYNGCGQSTALTMTQSTLACWSCGQNLTINHVAGNVAPVNKSTTYGTVSNVPGEETKCWITKNLGADIQAAAKEDPSEAAAGWYWQFNRMQGYKHDGTNRTPNIPWITIDENSNWTSSNDPCTLELGTGWRLPTSTEWTNVDASGSWGNYTHTYASSLKLHTAGNLYFSSGSLQNRTGNSFSKGYYWSGTQNNDQYSSVLVITSAASSVSGWVKPYGFSVRCIK